ncbi:MAG: hypothetical protein K0S32_400 [Bacteroidetes bacterium]|nr:hypothetical protein [Bacteroidota bacterium]
MALISLFTIRVSAQQWDGLTLYGNSSSNYIYLIDTASTVIKTYSCTGGGNGYSQYLTPGGTLWRTVINSGNALVGGGMHGKIQKWSSANTLLWEWTHSSSSYCLHHDICPMPNGNVLVISYDVKTPAQVVAAGGTSITVWSEKIMELKPVGTNSAIIVWQWNVWDHLVQNTNISGANYQPSIVNNPQLLNINYQLQKDWIHMNGVDYNPILDQIALSSHNLNEWYIIDHSTTTAEAASHAGGNAGKGGDILYRWGNPWAYQASGSAILNVTHDAHFIPEGVPGTGNLVGLNNKGVTVPSNKTTVDHITIPRVNYNYTVNLGNAYTPATYGSRHTSTGYTSNMGNSEQFPNGNQMVCLATAGTIYEIDAAGNVLWTKSTSGVTPQAHRYSTCFINNPAPPQPTITLSGTDLVSTTASSYQWYFNGDLIPGATSQTYTPSQVGIFVVRTTDANGCVYVYSAGFNPAMPTAIQKDDASNSITVYPNPTNGNVIIDVKGMDESTLKVTVFDNTGKIVLEKNETRIDLSQLSGGLYILNISNANGLNINKKISLIK